MELMTESSTGKKWLNLKCFVRTVYSRPIGIQLRYSPPKQRIEHFPHRNLKWISGHHRQKNYSLHGPFFILQFMTSANHFEPPAAANHRGHIFKVHQPRFHLARRKAAFARSAGPWNRLPPHIAEAPTVPSFKDRFECQLVLHFFQTLFDPTLSIAIL